MSDPEGGVQGARSIGQVVRIALGADVARLVASDPVARIGDDPEGVHQARVATRRLRSHLATFSPVLRERPTKELRGELRWLGRSLGDVRDLDVLGDRFERTIIEFDVLAKDEGEKVVELLRAERAAADEGLLDLLSSVRYRRLLGALARTVSRPPFRDAAGLPAELFLADAVRDRVDALAAAVADLPPSPPDTRLHEVRIVAKPARYVAELAGQVLGDGCARLGRRLADLCDELGLLNDGFRANQWLDSVAGDPERAVAIARLRAVEIRRMLEAREVWPHRWSKVVAALDAAGLPQRGVQEG